MLLLLDRNSDLPRSAIGRQSLQLRGRTTRPPCRRRILGPQWQPSAHGRARAL